MTTKFNYLRIVESYVIVSIICNFTLCFIVRIGVSVYWNKFKFNVFLNVVNKLVDAFSKKFVRFCLVLLISDIVSRCSSNIKIGNFIKSNETHSSKKINESLFLSFIRNVFVKRTANYFLAQLAIKSRLCFAKMLA